MMDNSEDGQVIEHSELIDMRTHLTVAMLAAAQLSRKTQNMPEAAHLQDYLDQSLKSLVADVGKVDTLVTRVTVQQPVRNEARSHPLPLSLRWGVALLKHGTRGVWGLLHHRQHARLAVLSLCR